jgi:hypothetical protein
MRSMMTLANPFLETNRLWIGGPTSGCPFTTLATGKGLIKAIPEVIQLNPEQED